MKCISHWLLSLPNEPVPNLYTLHRRLGHVLSNVLKPRAVLALTATATLPTQRCITHLLSIPADCIVCEAPLRDNLRLTVVHCNGGSKGGDISSQVIHSITKGTCLL